MKRNIVKVIVSTTLVAMLVMVVYITQNNFKKDVDDKGLFKYEIDFPQSAGTINANLVTKNNLNVSKVENSEILDTYYIVKEEISDERKEDIKEAFNMEKVKGSNNPIILQSIIKRKEWNI